MRDSWSNGCWRIKMFACSTSNIRRGSGRFCCVMLSVGGVWAGGATVHWWGGHWWFFLSLLCWINCRLWVMILQHHFSEFLDAKASPPLFRVETFNKIPTFSCFFSEGEHPLVQVSTISSQLLMLLSSNHLRTINIISLVGHMLILIWNLQLI